MFDEIKQPKKKSFLEAYINLGNITEASRIAGVDRVTTWRWRKEDEQFARAFKVADEVYRTNYLNELEQELRKRSLDPKQPMSTVALFFALKAEAP